MDWGAPTDGERDVRGDHRGRRLRVARPHRADARRDLDRCAGSDQRRRPRLGEGVLALRAPERAAGARRPDGLQRAQSRTPAFRAARRPCTRRTSATSRAAPTPRRTSSERSSSRDGPATSRASSATRPRSSTTFAPYVTIGLRTVFQTGDWSVLRLDQGNKNFSIICDPYWPQPSSVDAEAAFYYGCQPPYARQRHELGPLLVGHGHETRARSARTGGRTTRPPAPGRTRATSTRRGSASCSTRAATGRRRVTASRSRPRTARRRRSTSLRQPGPGAHAKCKSSRYTCYNPPTYFGSGRSRPARTIRGS